MIAPLSPLSGALHLQCLSWFSPNSETISKSYDLSRSFICGQKVTEPQQKRVLQKSGLYHAIVVSGGHFIFLQSLLRCVLCPSWLRFILLGVYYLMTGLQAPGLRCLMQMGLTAACINGQRQLSTPVICVYSGLLCLAVSSPLWSSLSFWLSFAVSLSLSFSAEITPKSPPIARVFAPMILIYIFLIPFNFSSGYLHPLNLIFGMLLLQPFCGLLLISAVLIILGRLLDTDRLFDFNFWINKNLFFILEKWTLIIPNKNQHSLSLFYLWFYLFSLLVALHFFIIYFRRETIRE